MLVWGWDLKRPLRLATRLTPLIRAAVVDVFKLNINLLKIIWKVEYKLIKRSGATAGANLISALELDFFLLQIVLEVDVFLLIDLALFDSL